jgi:hypothetical protein
VSVISTVDIRAILLDTLPMAHLILSRMAHLIRSPGSAAVLGDMAAGRPITLSAMPAALQGQIQ